MPSLPGFRVRGKLVKRRIAVFLDRDGTISEEVDYLDNPDMLRLIPRAAEAIRLINESGLLAVVVTNQSGIARGYFTEPVLKDVHNRMELLLKAEGAHIDKIYYCPHHPEVGLPEYLLDCDCRKPRTGMIEAAEKDFKIDVRGSYVVGDKIIDVELAHKAGTRGILVMTGYGREELKSLSSERKVWPDHIADDLYDAVKWILSQRETG